MMRNVSSGLYWLWNTLQEIIPVVLPNISLTKKLSTCGESNILIQQVNKFEKQNQNISVNIFGFEEKKIFPIRVTENKGRNHHVKLLLINNGNKYHYILMKDLSWLLSSQYKGYNRRLFFCSYCLHGCTSHVILERHEEKCKAYGTQHVTLPKKDSG